MDSKANCRTFSHAGWESRVRKASLFCGGFGRPRIMTRRALRWFWQTHIIRIHFLSDESVSTVRWARAAPLLSKQTWQRKNCCIWGWSPFHARRQKLFEPVKARRLRLQKFSSSFTKQNTYKNLLEDGEETLWWFIFGNRVNYQGSKSSVRTVWFDQS